MKTPEEQARENQMHNELPDGPELFRQDLFIENEFDFEPLQVTVTEAPAQPRVELIAVSETKPKPSVWKSWLGKLSREAVGMVLIALIKRYLIKPRRPLHNPKED